MHARRRVAVAAVLSALALTATTVVAADAAPRSRNRVDNVIYLLGDGMGRTHVTAGRDRWYGAAGVPAHGAAPGRRPGPHLRRAGELRPAGRGRLRARVRHRLRLLGHRLGVRGQDLQRGPRASTPRAAVVPTVMELAKDAGLRTGNVSTAEITDATPASQMSHVLLRGCQGPDYSARSCQNEAVTGGAQLPTSDVRVTPGGRPDRPQRHRRRHPRRRSRPLRRRRRDRAEGAGLPRPRVAGHADRWPRSPTSPTRRGRKVFGLFNTGNMTIERFKRENPTARAGRRADARRHDPQGHQPARPRGPAEQGLLPAGRGRADRQALARQRRRPGARGDQGLRRRGQAAAVAFARRDGHTLVVVTADHECAGFGIVEKGTFTNAEATTPPDQRRLGQHREQHGRPRSGGGQTKDPARSTGPINGSGAGEPGELRPGHVPRPRTTRTRCRTARRTPACG